MLAGDVLWWWQHCWVGLTFQDSRPRWGVRRSTAQSVRCLRAASSQCIHPYNTTCCTCSGATSAFPGVRGGEEWAWTVSGSHVAKEMGLGDHAGFTHRSRPVESWIHVSMVGWHQQCWSEAWVPVLCRDQQCGGLLPRKERWGQTMSTCWDSPAFLNGCQPIAGKGVALLLLKLYR